MRPTSRGPSCPPATPSRSRPARGQGDGRQSAAISRRDAGCPGREPPAPPPGRALPGRDRTLPRRDGSPPSLDLTILRRHGPSSRRGGPGVCRGGDPPVAAGQSPVSTESNAAAAGLWQVQTGYPPPLQTSVLSRRDSFLSRQNSFLPRRRWFPPRMGRSQSTRSSDALAGLVTSVIMSAAERLAGSSRRIPRHFASHPRPRRPSPATR
jgi:hypothetical protein